MISSFQKDWVIFSFMFFELLKLPVFPIDKEFYGLIVENCITVVWIHYTGRYIYF